MPVTRTPDRWHDAKPAIVGRELLECPECRQSIRGTRGSAALRRDVARLLQQSWTHHRDRAQRHTRSGGVLDVGHRAGTRVERVLVESDAVGSGELGPASAIKPVGQGELTHFRALRGKTTIVDAASSGLARYNTSATCECRASPVTTRPTSTRSPGSISARLRRCRAPRRRSSPATPTGSTPTTRAGGLQPAPGGANGRHPRAHDDARTLRLRRHGRPDRALRQADLHTGRRERAARHRRGDQLRHPAGTGAPTPATTS